MDAAPKLLPFAHPADLVRAHQKDEQCRGSYRQQVCEAFEDVVGHRRAAPWQPAVALAADCTYAAAAAAHGRPLGEEYCELLPVTGASLGEPSFPRRLLGEGLSALLLPLLRRLAEPGPRRGRGGAESRVQRLLRWCVEVAPLLLRAHLGLFYLFGAYRRVADRAVSVRFLSTSERPYRGPSYRPLGVLLLLQLAAHAIAVRGRRRRAAGDDAVDLASRTEAVAAMGPKGGRAGASVRAPLCYICMCPADCTTCTPCGHLFCWECIASWCAIKASCPLCRATALPQQLLPLNHYEVPAG